MENLAIINFKKAIGNIKRVRSMLEHNELSLPVLQLNAATLGLLKGAQQLLIQDFLERNLQSFSFAVSKRSVRLRLEEVLRAVKSYNK